MKAAKFVVSVFFFSAVSFGVTAFELPWMNRTSHDPMTFKSTDHPNSVFVIEAFYRACGPCNQNAPRVNELAEDYANEPRVKVLDVGTDRFDSDYATWISTHQPNHPVLKDSRRRLISQLGTSSYPSTYVIDCRMNIRYHSVGSWSSQTVRTLRDVIDSILATDCPAQSE